MTPLAQALARLAAAGRIRSAWLPGAKGFDTAGRSFRFIAEHHSGGGIVVPGFTTTTLPVSREFLALGRPDTTDPATVGCLLALLREAQGEPFLALDVHWPHHPDTGEVGWEGTRWCVWNPVNDGEGPYALSEGEAIAAALIALAEALPDEARNR